MLGERSIAGISCHEVLEKLSAFVDCGLDHSERQQLEMHLQSCPECERFGEEFSALLMRVRKERYTDSKSVQSALERLLARIESSEEE